MRSSTGVALTPDANSGTFFLAGEQSSVAHLEENMGAALLELSDREFEELSRARPA